MAPIDWILYNINSNELTNGDIDGQKFKMEYF